MSRRKVRPRGYSEVFERPLRLFLDQISIVGGFELELKSNHDHIRLLSELNVGVWTNGGQTLCMVIAVEVSEFVPLFDIIFLRAQLSNVEIVNESLLLMEEEVLKQWLEEERTPSEALVLKAFSEMWVFGFYELLRTWRQMTREVLEHAERIDEVGDVQATQELRESISQQERDPVALQTQEAFYLKNLERASDSIFQERVRNAEKLFRPVFKRLETLRVALAKHEVPGRQTEMDTRTYFATIPRIDPGTGSLYWFVETRSGEQERITRVELWSQFTSLDFASIQTL